MTAPPGKPTIMIVDDMRETLMLLERLLTLRGYRCRGFQSGKVALASIKGDPPDLILLDVAMPEIDGYTFCQTIKADEMTRDIPVIFISGLGDTTPKVKAFGSGGVDYVTKPFEIDEVVVRIETHLSLRRLHRQVQDSNVRLEEMVRQRTRQLDEAYQRLTILDRAKSDFLNLISHELRTPLNGILGVTELLLDDDDSEGTQRLRKLFVRTRDRLLTILDDALLLTTIEVSSDRFQGGPVRLGDIVTAAIGKAGRLAETGQVTFTVGEIPESNVFGDADLLTRAVAALLETSVKFTLPGNAVRLTSRIESGVAVVEMIAQGRPIPPHALGRFFEVLAIADPIVPGGDLGLGPAVSQKILSLFGGAVSAASPSHDTVRFVIHLKRDTTVSELFLGGSGRE